MPFDKLKLALAAKETTLINFTQRLVQTPSLSGDEGEVAQIVISEMQQLGYDSIWTDELGNVMGQINGGAAPTVLLNGHMDVVDPGPLAGWPYPPFSGQIVDGELWGRGSVDMKGPLACMIYGASLLKDVGLLPGNILMTVPVMEEVGGVGTSYLASRVNAAAAICGEPSRNILRRGHRGRVELLVTFKGKSAHASVPHLAVNPHYDAAYFLTKLPQIQLAHDLTLGSSTVTPTLYKTDQVSANVSPSEVYITLDWRNVAHESPAEIVAKVQTLADSCLAETGSQAQVHVAVTEREFTTYTNQKVRPSAVFPSFLLAEDSPILSAAHTTLMQLLGRDDGVTIWNFATDGGHLMAAGIPTIGFGPGDERLAHTNQERISLAKMMEATVAYAALVLALNAK